MTSRARRITELLLAIMLGVGAARADWIEIRLHDRLNLDAVQAIEFLNPGTERASLWLASRQETTADTTLVGRLKTAVTDTDWLYIRNETTPAPRQQYVRKSGIRSIRFNCPSKGTCSAVVEGIDISFSGLITNLSAAVTDLKTLAASTAFVLTEGDTTGFESYVRKASIQRVSFTCPTVNCTAATIAFVEGDSRISRDAAGIAALRVASR